MNTGIYCIRNLFDGKEYVGSAARNLAKRWRDHRKHLRGHSPPNWLLQAAWNACGESAFEFNVVEECPPKQCIALEQRWIDETHPAYNLCCTAGSQLGFRHSAASREKMSIAHLGDRHNLGRKHTLQSRANMSVAHSTPDYIEKARARTTGNQYALGYRNAAGYKHTPDWRMAHSLFMIGNKYALGNTIRRGMQCTAESRAKMRASWIIRKLKAS